MLTTIFKITSIVLLTGIIFCMKGCQYEHYKPAELDGDDTISFRIDIIPIFENDCLDGCHDNQGGIPPILTKEDAYVNLINGNYIDQEDPENSMLYKRMVEVDNIMPPDGKLPDQQLLLIKTWIEQGAQNN